MIRSTSLLLTLVFLLTGCAPAAVSPAVSAPSESASSLTATVVPSPFGKFTLTAPDQTTTIDETVFQNAELTMVTLWATFCGPCVSEMPDLQLMSEEYKDKGVQMMGVVLDVLQQDGTPSAEAIELTKEILAKTGVTYPNYLLNTDFLSNNVPYAGTTPETFFVDKNGDYVGTSYLGKRGQEEWRVIIDEKLAEVAEKAA